MIVFNPDTEFDRFSRRIFSRYTTEIMKVERQLQNSNFTDLEIECREIFQRRLIIERQRYRTDQNRDVFDEKY